MKPWIVVLLVACGPRSSTTARKAQPDAGACDCRIACDCFGENNEQRELRREEMARKCAANTPCSCGTCMAP